MTDIPVKIHYCKHMNLSPIEYFCAIFLAHFPFFFQGLPFTELFSISFLFLHSVSVWHHCVSNKMTFLVEEPEIEVVENEFDPEVK